MDQGKQIHKSLPTHPLLETIMQKLKSSVLLTINPEDRSSYPP